MNHFLCELFSLLNEKFQYAVLRNYETLPDQYNSRDIDLLIPYQDLELLKKTVAVFC